jgi:riboflavin synthase
MFTGLIDDVGVVERVERTEAGRELRVASRYTGLATGESIAVNGACLTVREHGEGWFTVAAIVTTLERTTIGSWEVGRRVNLERALRLGDRLGGHIVQGHVDAVGVVEAALRRDDALLVDLRLPDELEPLMVPHGSVAVDGVSLTVNALPAPGILQLSLIEYTWTHTTLGALRPGHGVHVEADMIGKYVRQLVAPYAAAR